MLFLLYKLATNVSIFPIFFLYVKKGNNYDMLEVLLDIEHQLQANILYHCLEYGFL